MSETNAAALHNRDHKFLTVEAPVSLLKVSSNWCPTLFPFASLRLLAVNVSLCSSNRTRMLRLTFMKSP